MRLGFTPFLAFALLSSGIMAGVHGQASLPNEVGLGTPDRTFREMVLDCGGTDPTPQHLGNCQAGVLAAIAGRGALGLSASFGSETPGSAATLGRRVSKAPRLSFGFRTGIVRSSLPRLKSGTTGGGELVSGYLRSGHLTGTLGILDGFSPVPNVRGLLSLDLLASGHWVSGSTKLGVPDATLGWGLGARVGLLRESFTLPGVTVSLVHRSLGNATIGDRNEGDLSGAEVDLEVTSLRGMVGKDIGSMGFLVGMGRDRYAGAVEVAVASGGGAPDSRASSTNLVNSRSLFFGGASMTFLLLQLSAEVGWSNGFNPDLVDDSGPQYAGERTYFCSLAARVTF